MADYTTTTFVKLFNQHRTYDTTSKPTLVQVASIIPTVTAEMNARFAGVGITVPITTSPTHSAYLYVKRLATMKTACVTEKTVVGGGRRNDKSGYATNWCDVYEKDMQRIEDNPGIMQALIDGVQINFNSYAYENTDEQRDVDDEPFARDIKRW